MRVTAATMQSNDMCVRTRCRSVAELVAMFGRYVDGNSIFIATLGVRVPGEERAFSIVLADGTVALGGRCIVREVWTTADNPFRLPGLLLWVERLAPRSRLIFERMRAERYRRSLETGPLPATPAPLADISDGTELAEGWSGSCEGTTPGEVVRPVPRVAIPPIPMPAPAPAPTRPRVSPSRVVNTAPPRPRMVETIPPPIPLRAPKSRATPPPVPARALAAGTKPPARVVGTKKPPPLPPSVIRRSAPVPVADDISDGTVVATDDNEITSPCPVPRLRPTRIPSSHPFATISESALEELVEQSFNPRGPSLRDRSSSTGRGTRCSDR